MEGVEGGMEGEGGLMFIDVTLAVVTSIIVASHICCLH